MDAAIQMLAKVLTVLWFVGMVGCLTFIPIAAVSWFSLAVRDWFRGGDELLPNQVAEATPAQTPQAKD